MVDDEDYSYISECYDLKIDKGGYVYCSPKKKFKGMGLYSMTLHKLLMNPDKKGREIVVDHRDGNKLNNQKDNLRVTTHANNMKNRKITEGGTSEYKGVSWEKNQSRWRAQFCCDKKIKNLGYFSSEMAAANCYNYYAKEYFGEFALLNEVEYMTRVEWEKFRYGNDKSSKYRGVSFVYGKWLVQIWDGKKNIRGGSFDNEVEAAKEYNKLALELKGDKARLNMIK